MMASTKSLDVYVWLTSDAAGPHLQLAARESSENVGGLVRLAESLRKELSVDQVHVVLEQVELRQRAKEKFSAAERMYFTPQSLMQATDEAIALYKARRFSRRERLADLCCGIGGDLLALAERGECVGVERDGVLAHLAQRNCEACGRAGGSLTLADAAKFPVQNFNAWHIDPDRRPSGKRTTRIEFQEPPLEVLDELLAQNPNAAIKLAPASDVPSGWKHGGQREWLESRGECRQQVIWLGALTSRSGERAATIVDAPDGPRTVQGRGEGQIAVVRQVGRFVYEPAACVLASQLTHVLCAERGIAAVSSKAMYLTGDAPIRDPALAGFEVLEVLPLDERRLKAWLRERQIGRLEVKKRGCDIEPARLQKTLSGHGEKAATLLICPIGEKIQAIIATRITSAAQTASLPDWPLRS